MPFHRAQDGIGLYWDEISIRTETNGTKKSYKLYGIKATALKAIEQWRRGQAVVLDAVSWKRSPQRTLKFAMPSAGAAIAYNGRVRHRCALIETVESGVQVV